MVPATADPALPVAAIVAAAREVGDHALMLARTGRMTVAYKPSSDGLPPTPVSNIDLAVDTRLKALLGVIAPDAAWLSEETVDDPARLSARRLWCVDPIDGTRDLVRGRSGWAVSVALIQDGQPAFGILYAPARDELWQAERGKGATCNGEPIRVGACATLPGARVPARDLPKVDRDLTMVEQPNSIALRLAMVAADRADLVATWRWGNEWDIAAAALIVTEAGGIVTDAFGAPLRFNQPNPRAFGLAAAAPCLHPLVVDRIAERAARAHTAAA